MSEDKQQEQGLDVLIGTAVYGFVRSAVEAGLSPRRAFALTAFGIIESSMGRQAVKDLGLPASTARQYARELAALGDEPAPAMIEGSPDAEAFQIALMNEVLPHLGLGRVKVVESDG